MAAQLRSECCEILRVAVEIAGAAGSASGGANRPAWPRQSRHHTAIRAPPDRAVSNCFFDELAKTPTNTHSAAGCGPEMTQRNTAPSAAAKCPDKPGRRRSAPATPEVASACRAAGLAVGCRATATPPNVTRAPRGHAGEACPSNYAANMA